METARDDAIEIQGRTKLCDFNAQLSVFLKEKKHIDISSWDNDYGFTWMAETLHILGITLWWEYVNRICTYWQGNLDDLFERMLEKSRSFIIPNPMGTMAWKWNMKENEELIGDILDFSKFWINTEFFREEVKKRTEMLLRKFKS